jgi:photosystem II stability/assembly factor-like uncharacterized protein
MNVCLSPNGAELSRAEQPASRLLVGTIEGITLLDRPRPGAPWAVTGTTLPGKHISALLHEPGRDVIFAGVHRGGLHVSRDGGRTWAPTMRGLTVDHVYSLAAVERDGRTLIYAGTEPVHLFVSADHGETWDELPAVRAVPGTERWRFPAPPHDAHVKHIAFHPRDPRTIFVSIEQGGLLKSVDAGRTFTELSGYETPEDVEYKDVHRCTIRPSSPDDLYITGGEGLYGSRDGGASWEHLQTPKARIGYPDHLFVSPLDERQLFMFGAIQSPSKWRTLGSAESGVARSRDGGRTWELLTRGLPEHMHGNIEAASLHRWPGGFGLYAANTDGEVYASEDGGESWSRIASGLPAVSKGGHFRQLMTA